MGFVVLGLGRLPLGMGNRTSNVNGFDAKPIQITNIFKEIKKLQVDALKK